MNNYKMTIQYDGGRYKGWQRLKDNDGTIQGKLENVLTELTGEQVEVIGCSRTDAGVHAYGQVANFKTESGYSREEVMHYLNRYLPRDISVVELLPAAPQFHSRYHAKEKTYLYQIWNEEYPNPFIRKYSMQVEQPLDLEQMRAACQYFLGSHDFTAFSNVKSKKKSMVREIYGLIIEKQNSLIEIRICGDGFLYNMVRKIVGILIEVGLGKRKADTIPALIHNRDRSQIGILADACGLILESITY